MKNSKSISNWIAFSIIGAFSAFPFFICHLLYTHTHTHARAQMKWPVVVARAGQWLRHSVRLWIANCICIRAVAMDEWGAAVLCMWQLCHSALITLVKWQLCGGRCINAAVNCSTAALQCDSATDIGQHQFEYFSFCTSTKWVARQTSARQSSAAHERESARRRRRALRLKM